MSKKKQTLYETYGKRSVDIIGSAAALIAFSPILAATAVMVRRKHGKPILFTHERPGKDGKIFKVYKFRTMTDARDAEGKLLPDGDRLTAFGKQLRRTSLDELPELFNVLKGDMSLVGPRPLEVYFLPYYTEEENHRHDVKPGLTGLAQISGRNALSWEQKFQYDLDYIRHITFLGDLKILLDTVKTVVGRKDVVEEGGAVLVDFNEERARKWQEEGRSQSHEVH